MSTLLPSSLWLRAHAAGADLLRPNNAPTCTATASSSRRTVAQPAASFQSKVRRCPACLSYWQEQFLQHWPSAFPLLAKSSKHSTQVLKLSQLLVGAQAGRQHHCHATAQSVCGVHPCALSSGKHYLHKVLPAALLQTLIHLSTCRVSGYTINKAATELDDNLYTYLLAHTREAQVQDRIALLQYNMPQARLLKTYSCAALL